VLGHSPLYNLLRERRTRTFVKVKDSDIVQKIAGDNGLSVQADDTEITHDYVIQANRTDLDFILERAAAVNFDLWYESGSVIFRPARTFETEIGSLAWTETLLSFTPRLDGRAGIHRVTVRGYDPEKKDAVTGSWTGGKGDSAETLVDPTVSTVAEADQLAKAIGEEVQARRVTGSASTVGDTRIMPGRTIDLRGVGRRFSGRYKIARATHRIGAAGYLTEFDVQGEGA
jgi:phage protein D